MSGEFSRIARLQQIYKWPNAGRDGADAGIILGIGDDAAVLRTARTDLVWTIDAQVEGRHFRREWLSFEDIGWRAYMAAASDLAAMGAEPWSALSSLVLPGDVGDDAVEALARGAHAAALVVGAPIVGGNLSAGSELSLTTTLLGRVAAGSRALTRSGAAPGDSLWLSGPVGLAAAGLRALSTNEQLAKDDPAVVAWRRPHARIDEGRAACATALAAIDVSDGLAQDVMHLAIACGAGARLEETAIVGAGGDALRSAARTVGVDAIDLALHGGEDYALVVASRSPVAGFSRIGALTREPGLRLVARDGSARTIAPRGFDHFAT